MLAYTITWLTFIKESALSIYHYITSTLAGPCQRQAALYYSIGGDGSSDGCGTGGGWSGGGKTS